jgi:hypothetical protein
MIHDPAWARTAELKTESAAAEADAKAKRAEAKRKAVAEAEKIVAIWNARQAARLSASNAHGELVMWKLN